MNRVAAWLLIALLPLAACSDNRDQPQTEAVAEAQEELATPAVPDAAEEVVAAETVTAEVVEAGEEETGEVDVTKEIVLASTEPTRPATSAGKFRAGKHYDILTAAQPTSSAPGQVEVLEFFMYTCPHCFALDPFGQEYQRNKPGYVDFVLVPVLFNPVARLHAKAFYTAQILGVLDKTHVDMFREIHNKKNFLGTEDELAAFFAARGVDEEVFRKTFNSFAVDTQIKRAATLAQRYQITTVPAVAINGKYRSGPSQAQGYEPLIEVVKELVAQEHAAP